MRKIRKTFLKKICFDILRERERIIQSKSLQGKELDAIETIHENKVCILDILPVLDEVVDSENNESMFNRIGGLSFKKLKFMIAPTFASSGSL
jgi:hypothetical protein